MQLAILSVVIAAIASAESGHDAVTSVGWRLLVVAIATVIAPVVALVGTQRLIAAQSPVSSQSCERFQSRVVFLWLLSAVSILLVAQWPRLVRVNWQLASWPLIDELAILLPAITALILVWAVDYRLERAAEKAACRLQGRPVPPSRLANYLWLQARHQLGLILLLPLALVGLIEGLVWLNLVPANIHTVWWFALPLVGAMLVLMPAAVRLVWKTTPLATGPLRDSLDHLCRTRNCAVRDALVWHTDGSMANAAVVGLSRHFRYLLLSDGLLHRLSGGQVLAVARHELAHLRRWHLPLRLAMLLLPVSAWLAITRVFPAFESQLAAATASLAIRPSIAIALGLPVFMLGYAVLVVGWYSRLMEHDADLDACLAADGAFDASAAQSFQSALSTLSPASESARGHWLHPSTSQRQRFLRQVANDPNLAPSFRRKLAAIATAVLALHALVALAGLLS
jgi:Zn-dependent protease with chaperone function